MNFVPVHPAQNLHLSDGVYVAEIRDVEERVYKVDSRLIHVLLWLPAEQVHLCTHFYFPHGHSIKSQQRLWHLCQAVGLELHQIIDEPELFQEKRLRIKTYSINQDGTMHSDVELFMPESSDADRSCAVGTTIHPLHQK